MLEETFWSIGIDGAAASAAAIGVVTDDAEVLSVITELIMQYPQQTEENVRKVVEEAQKILGNKALVHVGEE